MARDNDVGILTALEHDCDRLTCSMLWSIAMM